MKQLRVIIDAGHGVDTPGKRSPDGTFLEFRFAREIASELARRLKEAGQDAILLIPEDRDVPLNKRTSRANNLARLASGKKTILVSIHVDAEGSGKEWMSARGWSVRVSKNAGAGSIKLAHYFANASKALGFKTRQPSPNQPFWVQDLAICRDTICTAVLTENLFMDNREDLKILQSQEGRERILQLHFEAIQNYANSL